NWNGAVYTSAISSYNGRDQIIQSRQYAGATTSTTYQDTTAAFDGHGRLKTSHRPEQQNADGTPAYTTTNYNTDDSISQMTDARGAVTNYTYNSRNLVEEISWSVPQGSGITVPATVNFSYDNAGNRLTMEDAQGTTNYVYNSLSQMTSENREIEDLEDTFTLSYGYALSGQLKKITDPDGVAIDYTFDKVGRLNTVAGSGNYYSGVSSYASGFAYRAWGGVKEYDYANSTGVAVEYNSKLLPSSFEISGIKANANASPHTEGGDYTYYNDGKLKYATDIRTNGIHDRAFAYDHQGRMAKAYAGTQALVLAGLSTSTVHDGAFLHTFGYNAFGNRNETTSIYWNEAPLTVTQSVGNNLVGGFSYDADGRLLATNEEAPNELTYEPLEISYDAAGQNIGSTQTYSFEVLNYTLTNIIEKSQAYDGNGRGIKTVDSTTVNTATPVVETKYLLRSSLTGNTIAEYNAEGTKTRAYIYAGSQIIAQFTGGVAWQYNNPVIGDAVSVGSNSVAFERVTIDPTGVNTGDSNPFPDAEPGDPATIPGFLAHGMIAAFFPGAGGATCSVDDILVSCGIVDTLLGLDAAEQCPNNDCGPQRIRAIFESGRTYDFWSFGFRSYADGTSGQLFPGFVWNELAQMSSPTNYPTPNHVASLNPLEALFGGNDLAVLGEVTVTYEEPPLSDFSSVTCLNNVVDFLDRYARSELGQLDFPNANFYVGKLLNYLQSFNGSVTEATFAIANAYHETNLFKEFTESEAQARELGYSVDYRGRGYTHLRWSNKTGQKTLYNGEYEKIRRRVQERDNQEVYGRTVCGGIVEGEWGIGGCNS
ncbi:MAG: hypothetical protein ACRD6X_17660, partial [Pyrinomonadaceae bacterium]